MDANSPYYRICPACSKPHMVKNKGREYCSDKCYQDFYNATQRIIKRPGISNIQEEFNIEATEEMLICNKKLLDSLTIEPDGSQYKIHVLLEAGFNFSAYTYRYPLNKQLNILSTEYGDYETFLVKPDVILIHKKK
ncbi:MAG: hypothetical protein IPP27_05255 [Bacteroidetes bacterium]|nr:hypothetical protein [Bacteroidota bacterium]